VKFLNYRIVRNGRSDYSIFVEGTDGAVRSGKTPEELSKWAFSQNDTGRCRHDYNLRDADEDSENARLARGGKR
jgi:hypothetical protein